MICAASPVLRLLCIALTVYWVVLLARVILSWLEQLAGVRPPASGVLRAGYELLYDVTEPVLLQLRRIVPPAGPLDLSMLVAFVIVIVLQSAIC
jgi:YggT family protein